MRECKKCGQPKPVSDFWAKQSYCKECSKLGVAAWRARNPKRRRAQSRRSWEKWDEANPRDARKRALKRRRLMAHAGQLSQQQKMHVMRQCGSKCSYCGCDLNGQTVHIDHIIPVAQGGKTVYENLTATCERCNVEKGARTAEEYKRSKELEAIRTAEWDARAREIQQRVGVLPGQSGDADMQAG